MQPDNFSFKRHSKQWRDKHHGSVLGNIEHGYEVNVKNAIHAAGKAAGFIFNTTFPLPYLLKEYKKHRKEIKEKLSKLGDKFKHHSKNLEHIDDIVTVQNLPVKKKDNTMIFAGIAVVILIVIFVILKKKK